jgi:hypothetical protein
MINAHLKLGFLAFGLGQGKDKGLALGFLPCFVIQCPCPPAQTVNQQRSAQKKKSRRGSEGCYGGGGGRSGGAGGAGEEGRKEKSAGRPAYLQTGPFTPNIEVLTKTPTVFRMYTVCEYVAIVTASTSLFQSCLPRYRCEVRW